MFWNLNILLDCPQSLICVSFNENIYVNWKSASFDIRDVGITEEHRKIPSWTKRKMIVYGSRRLTWFLFESLFVYKHLVIKATGSRFPVNYAWEIAPIFMQSRENALSAWLCSFRRGNNFLTKSNRMSVKGSPNCLLVGIWVSMSPTPDNCTCWQINYLQYVTFQHLNGFLIRSDWFRLGHPLGGLFHAKVLFFRIFVFE